MVKETPQRYDKDKFRLHSCFHCGNQGLMPIRYIHPHDFGGPVYDEIGNIVGQELEEHFDWILLMMPVGSCVSLAMVPIMLIAGIFLVDK